MTTLVYELGKPKQDGSRKIAIILSHNGKRKRIPTNIVADKSSISKTGKITSSIIQKAIDSKMTELKNRLYGLEIELMDNEVDVEWVYNSILKKKENIDFFTFAKEWLQQSDIKGKKNYVTMLNSLKRYTGKETLLFSAIDYSFLEGYCHSLGNHPSSL